jgi:glycosyltransferase involved in cell wall biosynthesis
VIATCDARLAFASGIGTYIRNVLPEVLRQTEGSGVRFQVLYDPNEPGLLDLIDRARVSLTPCTAPPFSLAEQFVVPTILSARSRLLWVPHFNVPLAYTGRLAVTIHDVLPLAMPHFVRGLHRRMAARLMFRRLARSAAGILCDSQFTASELARLTAVDAARVRTVPLGVDDAWFKDGGIGDAPNRPYFLCVGNVKPHKNLSRLIDAFVRVSGTIPHDLVVVGRREGFGTGDSIVDSLARKAPNRVVFAGQVSNAELERYYRHATALVFPSLYEGFGLPALEAMAADCPVLASSAAALPEVCGDAALYFDPYDANDIGQKIVLLARDESLRSRLIAQGKGQASKFSWKRTGELTARILMGLLSKKSAPA